MYTPRLIFFNTRFIIDIIILKPLKKIVILQDNKTVVYLYPRKKINKGDILLICRI